MNQNEQQLPPPTKQSEGFEKFRPAEELPAAPLIGFAYGFIWIALLAYVVVVARGLGRVRSELADLRRKIESAIRPK